MNQAALGGGSPTIRLVIVPVLISLVVTLWRLTGELLTWSTFFFNPEAGGVGAVIGITWLAPIFGIYFALHLAKNGDGPSSRGKGDRLRRDRLCSSYGGRSRLGVSRSEEFPWGAGVHLVARCTDRVPPISWLAAVFQDGSCIRVGSTASRGPHYGACHARGVGHSLRRHPPRIPGDGWVGKLYVAGGSSLNSFSG